MPTEHESAAPLTDEWLVRRALTRCPRSAKCAVSGDQTSRYAVMGTLRRRNAEERIGPWKEQGNTRV